MLQVFNASANIKILHTTELILTQRYLCIIELSYSALSYSAQSMSMHGQCLFSTFSSNPLAAFSWVALPHVSWQRPAWALEVLEVQPSSLAAAVQQQSWIAKEPIAVQLRKSLEMVQRKSLEMVQRKSLEMAQRKSLEMAQRKSLGLAAHTLGQPAELHMSLEPPAQMRLLEQHTWLLLVRNTWLVQRMWLVPPRTWRRVPPRTWQVPPRTWQVPPRTWRALLSTWRVQLSTSVGRRRATS